ncbi:MAG: FAD-dependent oxidoreductase [Oleispira sp.]|nr:FAD-dependent oxidoreductase [Oleispira sp.]MBL4881404.1 FAD-dependent oxidoreductase [Oleispira sp.]
MKSKPTALNVAIIGGGLVGRLLAWRLISNERFQSNKKVESSGTNISDNGINFDVNVFEKGLLTPPQSQSDKAAAFTAAAMISPMSELVASELEIFKLGQQSLKLWPRWLDELGCPQHFHQQGSLVLAHPNDIGELQQFKRDLSFKLNKYSNNDPSSNEQSSPDTEPLQILKDRHQLEAIEPSIHAHFQTGLYLPSEAHIDHDEVLKDLVTKAKELGVDFIENSPLEPNDESLKDYDIIFDCRGNGLKEKDFRGVRGEVIRLECKEIILKRPIRLMHPRYKLYIVPKPNHQFIIGATEIESEDRSKISLRSSMELMSALYAVNPAFSEARILSQDTNLRPAFMDNLPRIETLQSDFNKPIIRINGLYRHGYLIGPALVEQVLNQLLELTTETTSAIVLEESA